MPWERHDNNMYDKVVHGFDVIKEELCRLDVVLENCYNIDEIDIMLSMFGPIKVLVGKDDRRDYRGTGTMRTMVTAIECVSASGECLNPMIISPLFTIHQKKFQLPCWVFVCTHLSSSLKEENIYQLNNLLTGSSA